MDINRWLRLIAGIFVLATLGLGHFVSPWWYLFTAFLGINLVSISLHQLVPDDDVPS